MVYRAVPVPPKLLAMLSGTFDLGAMAGQLLWPVARSTASRWVDKVITAAGLTGVAACPKGLRHGFAAAAVGLGITLNLAQKWLGHEDISTTAIYANLVGKQELDFAKRMWG